MSFSPALPGRPLAASRRTGSGDPLGTWVLVRYGKHVGLTERRMKIAQYVFRRHGALIVFFGRFVAVLRSIAALLAGANRMQWVEFVVFNCGGRGGVVGAVWIHRVLFHQSGEEVVGAGGDGRGDFGGGCCGGGGDLGALPSG